MRTVKYLDKRCVMFLTTYASVLPSVEKQKYGSKQRFPSSPSNCLYFYNSHMGGVDRLDHMLALMPFTEVASVHQSFITKFSFTLSA